MKLAFFGTPAFAVPTLRALLDSEHEVALVVAQPDKPAGRGNALQTPPTIELARARGVPTLQPAKVKTGELPETLEALGLDIAVVVAYGRILTPRLLAAPRLGCINVHASLLPRWRGAAPIQWSVLAGDATTGVATMQMAEGLDTGDILLMEETPIGPEETAADLFVRLSELGAPLLLRTLAERPTPIPQDERHVTLAPMLTKEHARIDWTRPARELDWQVRGLSPWPGTVTTFRGEPLKVLRARPVALSGPLGEPGTFLDGPVVACGEGALELLEVQLPGKKGVRGVDFVNGSRVKPGERLG
ncbi:MAG: methionyl-tRNA formyltransferase [Pseudomonadota bacterium]|nr:methionyl-tRNA formyltransferase [Pseudomonadota bacterium]